MHQRQPLPKGVADLDAIVFSFLYDNVIAPVFLIAYLVAYLLLKVGAGIVFAKPVPLLVAQILRVWPKCAGFHTAHEDSVNNFIDGACGQEIKAGPFLQSGTEFFDSGLHEQTVSRKPWARRMWVFDHTVVVNEHQARIKEHRGTD